MAENIDEVLGKKYGDYAGFVTDSSPAIADHFGEDPLLEIKRLLKLYVRPESRILDIGCGSAQTLCQLAPFVQEAWGLEPAQDLLAGAHERIQELGLSNVRLVAGSSEVAQDVAQLPDNYFDLAFSESGPGINAALITKLTPDAYFLQEVGGQFSGYPLQEILGRVPFTNYANQWWDQSHLIQAAELGLLPVSFKHYFWEVYFRDLAHPEAYVSKEAVLSNWRLSPRPYQKERDRPALELYARYNMTAKGIRLLYHVQILVWRHAPIHYYPIDNISG